MVNVPVTVNGGGGRRYVKVTVESGTSKNWGVGASEKPAAVDVVQAARGVTAALCR